MGEGGLATVTLPYLGGFIVATHNAKGNQMKNKLILLVAVDRFELSYHEVKARCVHHFTKPH